MPIDLTQFARDEYSNGGEDGILEHVFEALGVVSGCCVELGAWDGIRLSNTRRLAERGWQSVMIEADPALYAAVRRNAAGLDVTAVHCHVEPAGDNSLDAVLDRSGVPEALDLLSIDIDSDDLGVWMSLRRRPTCVVIEYNNTIPFDTEFINPVGRAWGNSALSIARFAAATRYALVAVTPMNLVFLTEDARAAADIASAALDTRPRPTAPRSVLRLRRNPCPRHARWRGRT